jgi:hypothetical protein
VVGQPAEGVKPGEARPNPPQVKSEKSPSPAVSPFEAKNASSATASAAVKPAAKPATDKPSTAAASRPAQATPAKTPEPPKTAKAPEPPKTVKAPPAAAATAKPAAAVPPTTSSSAAAGQAALPAGKQDIQGMSIDDLTAYIERTYADQMSQTVRKSWLGGMRNYYHSENPEVVRRDVFMALLRSCWKEQRPGEMRNAFATLYLKLKYPSASVEKK